MPRKKDRPLLHRARVTPTQTWGPILIRPSQWTWREQTADNAQKGGKRSAADKKPVSGMLTVTDEGSAERGSEILLDVSFSEINRRYSHHTWRTHQFM